MSNPETRVFAAKAAWLAARREGISSSEAAAILGVSPWKTPLALYAEKLGLADPQDETEAMRWGTLLEPLVASRYAEETERELVDAGRFTLRQSTKWPRMLATLDREIVGGKTVHPPRGVLEIKTTGYLRVEEWEEEPPLHVQVQTQHQLAVMDWSWASIAVLVGGQRFLWCDIERNDRFIALLVERVEAFWSRLERLDPPSPGADDRQMLARLYPKDTGASVDLPADAAEWDRRLQEAKDQIKTWETVKDECESLLKGCIGEATYGVLPGSAGRYSWRASERHEAPREARVLVVRPLRRLTK